MTPEYVRALFDYDSNTGELRWKRADGRRAKVGSLAGWTTRGRYRTTRHDGRVYLNHRLVWLWHGRELPKMIDHINGDKLDNRIENLRAATPSQNQCNHPIRCTNKSGVKGVHWDKRLRKWHARVFFENRTYPLGWFTDLEQAKAAANAARTAMHGEFARLK